MKMSCDPAAWATSRSWWTSCQSRVAIAVLTIVVGVSGRLHSGSTWPASSALIASLHTGRVSSSSTSRKSTRSRVPIATSSGATSTTSPTIRTPSSRSISAITIGSSLPGTGGCRCTT